MKTAKIYFAFILFLFTQTGCITLYKPNSINTPLLKVQGELKGTVGLSESGCGLLNVQGAYALSNHVGVLLNGMYH